MRYDMIYLADNEWENEKMREVAQAWFSQHPEVEFVEVHEHGGWYLGYRRDLTIWSTANDMAPCPGPKPIGYSGVCVRRCDGGCLNGTLGAFSV